MAAELRESCLGDGAVGGVGGLPRGWVVRPRMGVAVCVCWLGRVYLPPPSSLTVTVACFVSCPVPGHHDGHYNRVSYFCRTSALRPDRSSPESEATVANTGQGFGWTDASWSRRRASRPGV